MKIVAASLHPYAWPFRVPVETAVGRFERRQGWLLALRDEAGRVGLGEAAPWPGFGSSEGETLAALTVLVSSVRAWGQASVEESAAPSEPWERRLVAAHSVMGVASSPEASAALETALLDLQGQAQGLSVSEVLMRRSGDPTLSVATGGARQGSSSEAVVVHARVTNAEEARRARDHGFKAVKVKVGVGDWRVEDATLAAIRSALGADVALRLDANGAWTVPVAVEALRAFARHDVALCEQPVAAGDVEGLARVRSALGGLVQVAADEAVTGAAGLGAVLAADAADVVVVKPMFVGGPSQTLRLALMAQAAGVQVMLTHALEGVVGRLMALHTAAAMSTPVLPCGLAGAPVGPAAEAMPTPELGALKVPTLSGLGVRAEEVLT